MSGKAGKRQSAPAEPVSPERPLYTERDLFRVAGMGQTPGVTAENYRSAFRRDYARLIHCPAFRRLQGKAQLFPCQENDYFRNRLTHSLEVAQIAKSIAIRLNDVHPYFTKHNIDTNLVEFAGLAHDIGHPPFGHNGEAELDKAMLEYGGFEGNAQTLRILSKLEKKQTTTYPHDSDIPIPIAGTIDNRVGLNLTYRSMASILKYDNQIPRNLEARVRDGTDKKPVKGFYYDELELVRLIKDHVVGREYAGRFKTIECSIMDIADDIAYSTYDLEDAFKGGFLTPLKILAMPREFKNKIVSGIKEKIDRLYGHLSSSERSFTIEDYEETIRRLFVGVLMIDESSFEWPEGEVDLDKYNAFVISMTAGTSESICQNGYYRTEFMSQFVGRFIRAVNVELNEQFPAMSNATLSLEAFIAVEILKTLAFEAVIMSSRLKSAENRGQWIVQQIYRELIDSQGYLLMPEDWRSLVLATDDNTAWKRRMICDYIAGMTDAYCLEFYDRILGRAAPSIQKQH